MGDGKHPTRLAVGGQAAEEIIVGLLIPPSHNKRMTKLAIEGRVNLGIDALERIAGLIIRIHSIGKKHRLSLAKRHSLLLLIRRRRRRRRVLLLQTILHP